MQQGNVGGYEPWHLGAASRPGPRSRNSLVGGHPIPCALHQLLEVQVLTEPVAINVALSLLARGALRGGQGVQEKTIAELKATFALEVVPICHYGANGARQQLSVIADHVVRGFRLHTIAEPRRRSGQRTHSPIVRNMRTLRFLLITRAGRLTGIGGRNVFRLPQNLPSAALYSRVEHALAS